jgi:LPS export ABC transporter permease LptF
MRIIRNYFLREFGSNLIHAFVGITFILLLGNLVQASDLVIRKGVDIGVAGKFFLFTIPYLLQYSLPLACLLGILLCMGRFAADNEFVAIKVAGIGLWRILKIFLIVGMTISLFLIFLHVRLIPYSHYMTKSTLKEIGKENPLGLIEPGVFVDAFKDFVLFTHDMEDNILKRVYIYQLQEDAGSVIFAERGEFVVDGNVLKVKLQDGFIEGPNMQYRVRFQNHFMHLPIEKNKKTLSKKAKHMGIKEINSELKLLKHQTGSHVPEKRRELQIELHRKISTSFASVIFVLLGFGVAGRIRGRERSTNLSVIFIVGLGYYLISLLCTTLVEKHYLPVYGIWLTNIVFLAIGGYYSWRACTS